MQTPTVVPVLNWENRSNKSGKYPIHLRITLGRSSKYLNIHLPEKVSKDQWYGKDGRWVKENHRFAFEINDKIREVRNKIDDVIKRFYMYNKQITFQDIFQHLKKKGDDKIFNDFVAEYIRLKPEKLEIVTWEKYTTFLNHLNEFNPKIPFVNLTPSLVRSFKNYLEDEKGFTGSTMKVYFDKFKKVVSYAEKENYIHDNQTKYLFDDISIKVNKPKRIYLEIEEIKLLKSIKFEKDQLSRERDRDLFLFQIYTGCYYNDLKSMKKSQLVKDPQYGHFILGERDKNGNDTIIPLFKFPHADYILKKYPNTDIESEFLFPRSLFIDSHVYNRTLKKIASSKGITKDITGKVARHTNAQLWIRYGAERPIVSKMLGHKKEETTKHYFSVNIPEIVEGTKRVDFAKLAI